MEDKDSEILNEIMINIEKISLEDQEKVLSIIKAMTFTKKCIDKEKNEK